MRRHELDLVSLVAGVLFVLVAVAYVYAELADMTLDGEWVLPIVLVGLGLLGLVATLWGGRTRTEAISRAAIGPEPIGPEPVGPDRIETEPIEPDASLETQAQGPPEEDDRG